jgi:hypothetical protein
MPGARIFGGSLVDDEKVTVAGFASEDGPDRNARRSIGAKESETSSGVHHSPCYDLECEDSAKLAWLPGEHYHYEDEDFTNSRVAI